MNQQSPPRTAASLLAGAEEIAARVDDAQVEVRTFGVHPSLVLVQLTSEDDVDRVATGFGDADIDSGASGNYTRTTSLGGVSVLLYSPRTDRRCVCGGRCNHEAVLL